PSRARNLFTAWLKFSCVTPLGSREAFCSDMDQTPSGLDRKGNEAAVQWHVVGGDQRSHGRTAYAQRAKQVTQARSPLLGVRHGACGTGQLTGRCGTARALFV